MRRCRTCKKSFEPKFNTLQNVCSPPCAIKYANTEKGQQFAAKQKRKETRELKEKIKTKSDWGKEAKKELAKWIRLRDKKLPCISCGNPNPLRTTWGQWDAGHYRSVGSCPELEFEPLNIAKQCKRCNAGNRLSGNPVGFRNGLIERLGIEKVEWLDGPHETTHYRIDDYKAIKAMYRQKIKDLNT